MKKDTAGNTRKELNEKELDKVSGGSNLIELVFDLGKQVANVYSAVNKKKKEKNSKK